MSKKNLDKHNRWRNVTVAFRVSPEEDELIEKFVSVSGLTKQDYIIHCLQRKAIEVRGNPRVYKALRNQFADVLEELKRIESGQSINPDLLELIHFMSEIMAGMREGVIHD